MPNLILRRMAPRYSRLVSVSLYAIFVLALLEAALRLQQKLGPLDDLVFLKYDPSLVSDTLNHIPNPKEGYDSRGIQLNPFRSIRTHEEPRPATLLFMGDSFMQGLGGSNSIPHYAGEFLEKKEIKETPFLLLNAGYSSYSPAIYIPQAKKLIPEVKPDLLVIDLDETDLVDDFGYRPLIRRDAAGRIIGVSASPVYKARVLGFSALKKQPLYTVRFAAKQLLKMYLHFAGKWYRQKYKSKYYQDPLSDSVLRFSYNLAPAFDRAAQGEVKYAEEIRFFEQNVKELLETLTKLMGDRSRILVLYHPHAHHLTPDFRGFLWRGYVRPILEKVSGELGIDCYDATADLKKAFGAEPAEYYRRDDMHFNEEGLRIYGELAAARISKKPSLL